MPRLPSLNSRIVIAFLKSKGFELDHVSGSHFVFYHHLTLRRAVVPKSRSLPKGTLFSILREAGFNRMDIEEYLRG